MVKPRRKKAQGGHRSSVRLNREPVGVIQGVSKALQGVFGQPQEGKERRSKGRTALSEEQKPRRVKPQKRDWDEISPIGDRVVEALGG